jgi:hypothetical protein
MELNLKQVKENMLNKVIIFYSNKIKLRVKLRTINYIIKTKIILMKKVIFRIT